MAKKRFFQISLRSFLILFLLVGVGAGFWMRTVEPVRQQWLAAEPILRMGGRVETIPSNIPNWLKSWLPAGKSENIESVTLQHLPATEEGIAALKRLPHLKRLFLETVRLRPQDLDSIAMLTQLERLSIQGNQGLTNTDLSKLASLENLKELDIRNCGCQDWRTLLAFRKNCQTTIKHSFYQATTSITSADINERLLIRRRILPFDSSAAMNGADTSILEKVRLLVPNASSLWVNLRDDVDIAFLRKFRQLNQQTPFRLELYAENTGGTPVATLSKRSGGAIALVWKEFGSDATELEIETHSGYSDSNTLILRSTEREHPFEIGVFCSQDELPENLADNLPDLPNVQSFVFNQSEDNIVSALEPLLFKIPNVTEVKLIKVRADQQGLWRPLSKMRHVRNLSIYQTRMKPLDSLPENFPNDFEFRKTLTHFSTGVFYPIENEFENLINAFPNLESFTNDGEEMIKPE